MENFLETILTCKEEELTTIIKEKIYILENMPSTERKTIAPNESKYDYESYYVGFIKNDVKIYFSMDMNYNAGYTLGNYDYLFTFFSKIRELNIKTKIDIIKYLPTFMEEYFGKYCGTDKREEYLIQYKGEATIDCLKGKGLAACSERAAIANNILEMLDTKSIYVTGNVENEQHAFNILIDKNNKYFLLDTTSACGLYDEENNLIGSASYFFKLGEISNKLESFLLEEKTLTFPDLIARKHKDGKVKYEMNGRVKKYTIEPIMLEEIKKRTR